MTRRPLNMVRHMDRIFEILLSVHRWWCGKLGHEMKDWAHIEGDGERAITLSYRFCKFCAHHDFVVGVKLGRKIF